jgi:phosphonate transport system substrate-binding protein
LPFDQDLEIYEIKVDFQLQNRYIFSCCAYHRLWPAVCPDVWISSHKEVFIMMKILACCLLVLLSSPSWAEPFKLAIYPSNDPKKLIIPMQVMAEYLTQKSGDPFIAVVTRDYAELSERLRNKSIQLAWINPVNYIKMKSETPSLQYVATYMEKNTETGNITPYYKAFIISLKSSNIHTVFDAENKKMGFTDPGSTSGYAFPMMMLRQKNIVPDTFFQKVFFLKKHDRVIEALVNGSIDIGAVSDGTYDSGIKRHGDIFSIVEKSDPIPLDPIVAPDTVPEEKIRLYQQILKAMPDTHEFNRSMRDHLGWNAAGFDIRDDQFYDSMRQALK